MQQEFTTRYKALNAAQKQAVDTIDGPVMVVAGPGTGKTELLSLRVANILQQTDTAPANILCLTFTDNASRNMRDRLSGIIGQPAYHVAIHTFHSFGVEVINQYSDYFTQRQLLQQVDELGRYELLRSIFEGLPHSNPLSTRVGDQFIFLYDTLQVISWLKQNALTPLDLEKIIKANETVMKKLADVLAETFSAATSPKHLDQYTALAEAIRAQVQPSPLSGFPDYAQVCAGELEQAIAEIPESGRYAPSMTAWRNRWCQKDAQGNFVFKDAGQSARKLWAVAHVYEKFQASLTEQGLYDFDDMIMEVVQAIEQSDELRLNIQERYQYVLVDEFQDTNKAQLRILQALGNNPIYEGRPNIMTVGDDDQAIYAFQGAEVSNMVTFSREYRDPVIITLVDNYRSSGEVLAVSQQIAKQIDDRLEQFTGIQKQLVAQNQPVKTVVEQLQFSSELAQYDWIAEQIEKYIKQGIKPEEIAILAPKHRYLERVMPYLGQRKIPVAYERRENILESPIIIELLTMTELLVAITEQRHDEVDALLSQVLSYDFWRLPTDGLIELSLHAYQHHQHWLEAINKQASDEVRAITNWLIELSKQTMLQPLEYILDALMGGIGSRGDSEYDEVAETVAQSAKHFVSPMHDYYFNQATYSKNTDVYLSLLGQLSTLRQRLRQWKPADTLYAKDLVTFTALHRSAKLKIIDTNPHTQTTNAVQVMTAYKAKGLEFEVVFAINAQDEVWGPTARSRGSTISLPKNLPLAPASDGDNDKLRLLYVALTRAKHTLLLTGYKHTLENKLSPELSYISGIENLTEREIDKPATTKAQEILTTDWNYRFRHIIADKPTLFEPILANYKLSATHLNNFLDVVDGGPEYFLQHNLLRFPQAPTPAAAYGDAIHKTLQWTHIELRTNSALPSAAATDHYFTDMLQRKHLTASDHKKFEQRGHQALKHYLQERGNDFAASDLVERGFNNEGVVIAGALLSGKIDKLHFLDDHTVSVIDFKTGKPARNWAGKDDFEKRKLHKYRQQLLFYKLLVEHSASFSGKLTVSQGALEFIEPNEEGQLVDNLDLEFDQAELERLTKLIGAVWHCITTLQFPDTSKYAQTSKGVQDFENDLINGTI